jgi:hypothetical protein
MPIADRRFRHNDCNHVLVRVLIVYTLEHGCHRAGPAFRRRRSVRFDEIVAVRRVTWCESLRIDGSDGSTIFVPLGHNGSREFTDTLGERLDARMGGHFRNRYSRLQISIGGVFRETLH